MSQGDSSHSRGIDSECGRVRVSLLAGSSVCTHEYKPLCVFVCKTQRAQNSACIIVVALLPRNLLHLRFPIFPLFILAYSPIIFPLFIFVLFSFYRPFYLTTARTCLCLASKFLSLFSSRGLDKLAVFSRMLVYTVSPPIVLLINF